MGLLKKLKNQGAKNVDNGSTDTIDINSVINKLKLDERISNNPLIFDILELSLDLPHIQFGIEGVSSVQVVYNNFLIPQEELIVLSVRNKDSMFGNFNSEKLVITDKAIYVPMQLVKKNNLKADEMLDVQINRILLNELCQYVLCVDNYLVELIGINKRIKLIEKNIIGAIFSNNEIENSICKIIETIQNKLSLNYSHARTDKENLYQFFSYKADEELQEGCLSDTVEIVLQKLKEMFHEEEIGLILLHNALKRCDRTEMTKVLTERLLESKMFQSGQLQSEFELYVKNFKKEVMDENHVYDNNYLNKITIDASYFDTDIPVYSYNTPKDDILKVYDDRSYQINAYMVLRKNCQVSVFSLITFGNKYMNENETKALLKFAFVLRNRRMEEIYRCIQENAQFDNSWYLWRDSYGLTPLHYAFLLQNKEKIDYMIRNISRFHSSLETQSDDMKQFLEYGVWAILCNLPEYIDPLIESSDEMKKLITKKNNESIKNTGMKLGKSAIKFALKSYSDNLVEAFDNFTSDSSDSGNKKITELEEMIADRKQQIKEQYDEMSIKIQQSEEPLLQYYMRIINEPSILATDLLCSTIDAKLTIFSETVFMIPIKNSNIT